MIRHLGLVHRKGEDGEDISEEALAKLRKYNETRGVRGQKRNVVRSLPRSCRRTKVITRLPQHEVAT